MDALFWIKRNEKSRDVFVENRVQKIRVDTPPECWRFCPGNINPADLPSRGIRSGMKAEDLYKAWIAGPEFIRKPAEIWPADKSCDEKVMSQISDRVLGRKARKLAVMKNVEVGIKPGNQEVNLVPKIIPESSCLHVSNQSEDKTSKKTFQMRYPIEDFSQIDQVIDIQNYNRLGKLLRVSAYVIRYVNNLKRKVKKEEVIAGHLKWNEIKDVKILWIKSVQRDLVSKSKQLNN